MQNSYATFLQNNLSHLATNEIQILNEVGEIALDFAPLNSHKSRNITPKIAVIGLAVFSEFENLNSENLDSVNSQKAVLHGFLKDLSDSKKTLPKFQNLEIFFINSQDFLKIDGSFGEFEIFFNAIDENGAMGIDSVSVAQAVFFTKFSNLAHKKGIHLVSEFESAKALIHALHENTGFYEFESPIIFNPKFCDYQERRAKKDGSGYCGACADVCDTFGIFKDDSKMQLNLSGIDCVACGECVSVCPTGAVWRESESLVSISEQAKMYAGKVVLVLSALDSENFRISEFAPLDSEKNCENSESKTHFLPLIINQPNILNRAYLLTLIQEAGAQVIVYAPYFQNLSNSICEINEITTAIFGHKLAYFVDSKKPDSQKELRQILKNASAFESARYAYNMSENQSALEVFSQRLFGWVRAKDFGKLELKNTAIVRVDSQKCTLCMSCVQACNTNALINNKSAFELLFKASLCTACGYCKDACAEQVITLESGLELSQKSFEYASLASDEPFKCAECGKIFATKKSIEKIRGVLASVGALDELKAKTLECCADCKIQVIFGPKGNS